VPSSAVAIPSKIPLVTQPYFKNGYVFSRAVL